MSEEKKIPEPVRLAQEALKILAAEEDVPEGAAKQLPAYAMNLARAGEQMTVDLLLARTREGALDQQKAPAQKARTYAQVVEKLPVPPEPEDSVNYRKVMSAIREGHLAEVRQLLDKYPEELEYMHMADIAAAGHLDIVKFFVEEKGRDVRLQNDRALRAAAAANHVHIVKYLVEECGADIYCDSDMLLNDALTKGYLELVKYLSEEQGMPLPGFNAYAPGKMIENGHLEAAKYLIQHIDMEPWYWQEALKCAIKGGRLEHVKYFAENSHADLSNGGLLLLYAIQDGNLDIVKYFVEERGLKPDERSLANAAQDGNLGVVKYFIEEQGVDPKLEPLSLVWTIKEGHTDILKYLVEKQGFDVRLLEQEMPVREVYPRVEFMKYLVDHGFDLGVMKEFYRQDIESSFANIARWQRVAHTEPPVDVLHPEDPAYYRPKAYDAVRAMLAEEGYKAGYHLAFNASGLFGTEDRVLQYLEKWGEAGKQPLHDIIYQIELPIEKTPEMDLKSWGDAVLKCGPSMAKLVQFADRLPVPLKSDDGRTWSMVKTRAEAAKLAYANADKNPDLAAICFENLVSEKSFDKALALLDKAPETKNMPDIALDGDTFNMPGATFRRLDNDDPRGLFLGQLTDCCQSIGGAGEGCATQGFTSENGGFYVVENAKGKIVGQTWAWRGKKGELVFDSFETLGANVSEGQWEKLAKAFGKALAQNPGDVTALHVGMGGATPRGLAKAFNEAAKAAKPVDYDGYRDSHKQAVIWRKKSAGLA